MIEFKDKALFDIIYTHLSFMNEFTKDDDVSYKVIVAENKYDVDTITATPPDTVTETGNYYEATFIEDSTVTVAVFEKSLANEVIRRLL